MKISMLGSLPPIKGVSQYTLGLVNGVAKSCEIDFFGFKSIYPEFLYPGGTKTDESIPKIKNLKIYNYISWYNPLTWIKTGFAIKTDIVHAQWWSWVLAPEYFTILTIAKIRGKKIVMTLHNVKPHEKSLIKVFLNKSVVKLADSYIIHNENNKQIFLSSIKTDKPISIIPHGLIEYPKSNQGVTQLKSKYDFKKTDKILLFYGNIRDYKGLDILLNSLKNLEKDIKLLVAGSFWEGSEKYKTLINNLQLKDRVKILQGFQTQKISSELFKLADIVVLPYKEFEASSGLGALALDYEKAMVVTDVGGLADIVKDKNVIAKANNSADLAKKIIYALKNTKRLEKDSKMMKKQFSSDKIAKMTMEVYGE